MLATPCVAVIPGDPIESANSVSNAEALKITADSAEFDDLHGTATYKGRVVAVQGYRNLWADLVVIKRGANDKIASVVAHGKPAKIKSKPQQTKAGQQAKPDGFGYASTIKYYPELDKVELIGNAELEQNGDLIKGEFLTYFFEEKRLISNKSSNSRTTVIIQPRNKS
jgi:lipopolysaccharide transport protein LptA